MEISTETCAYFAGYFDGEGSILISKRGKDTYYPSVSLSLSNTDEKPVRLLQQTFGGHILVIKPRAPRHKVQFTWRVSKRSEILTALTAIIPWLITKKAIAEAALTILRNAPGKPCVWRKVTDKQVVREVEAAFLTFGKVRKTDRALHNKYPQETRRCAECGHEFTTRRCRKAATCSRRCASKLYQLRRQKEILNSTPLVG
jgi:predicted Zn-ribbon and HTH transcriptional regulator